MKLSGSYSLAAPRSRVFKAITDPDILQQSIEGCQQMVKTGPDAYDAFMQIGIAGLKGNYVGKVQLKDLKAPESYTLLLEGKGKPGFVKGTAKIQLLDLGEKTQLVCDAEAQVGGMIALVGSRLVEAAAKKMMDAFFKKLAEQWE